MVGDKGKVVIGETAADGLRLSAERDKLPTIVIQLLLPLLVANRYPRSQTAQSRLRVRDC